MRYGTYAKSLKTWSIYCSFLATDLPLPLSIETITPLIHLDDRYRWKMPLDYFSVKGIKQ